MFSVAGKPLEQCLLILKAFVLTGLVSSSLRRIQSNTKARFAQAPKANLSDHPSRLSPHPLLVEAAERSHACERIEAFVDLR